MWVIVSVVAVPVAFLDVRCIAHVLEILPVRLFNPIAIDGAEIS
jgi:hypothetical protein